VIKKLVLISLFIFNHAFGHSQSIGIREAIAYSKVNGEWEFLSKATFELESGLEEKRWFVWSGSDWILEHLITREISSEYDTVNYQRREWEDGIQTAHFRMKCHYEKNEEGKIVKFVKDGKSYSNAPNKKGYLRYDLRKKCGLISYPFDPVFRSALKRQREGEVLQGMIVKYRGCTTDDWWVTEDSQGRIKKIESNYRKVEVFYEKENQLHSTDFYEILIYPNPFINEFDIDLNSNHINRVELHDVFGKFIKEIIVSSDTFNTDYMTFQAVFISYIFIILKIISKLKKL